MKRQKKQYRQPRIEDWGTVEDLTACGNTMSGTDTKDGSVPGCAENA